MKTLFFPIALCLLISCKKPVDNQPDPEPTKPVDFSSSTYENTCTWNAAGKPNCLESPDAITTNLLAFLDNNLKEGGDLRTYNPALLSNGAMADVTITQASDVFVTFVLQTTGLQNALAYYTFPTGNPPKSAADIQRINFVFPSVGKGTPLQPGDKVKLGRFGVGTSIGFVLLTDAWDPTTGKPNSKAVHYCTNDALNPEVNPQLKKHAVLLNFALENKTLIGFEDSNRTNSSCDHDFNDAVLYVTLKP